MQEHEDYELYGHLKIVLKELETSRAELESTKKRLTTLEDAFDRQTKTLVEEITTLKSKIAIGQTPEEELEDLVCSTSESTECGSNEDAIKTAEVNADLGKIEDTQSESDDNVKEIEDTKFDVFKMMPAFFRTVWKFCTINKYYDFNKLTIIAVNLGNDYICTNSFNVNFPRSLESFKKEFGYYYTKSVCDKFCFQTGYYYSNLYFFDAMDEYPTKSRFGETVHSVATINLNHLEECKFIEANTLQKFKFSGFVKEDHVFKNKNGDQIMLFLILMKDK